MKISIYEHDPYTSSQRHVLDTTCGNKQENFYMDISRTLMEMYQDKMEHGDMLVISIITSKGNARYQLTKSSYSLRIFEQDNNIQFDDILDFPNEYHLEMIGVENNNYKYYDLKKIGENQVTAVWGRIAPRSEAHLRNPYTYQQAYMKLGEKLAKGYKDMSFKLDKPIENKESEIKDTLNRTAEKDSTFSEVSADLYQKLLLFSKNMVKKTFTDDIAVTETMVRKATNLYRKLIKQTDVKEFNEILLEIMLLAPRRIDFMCGEKVSDYIARTEDDFKDIIDREETILNSLKVVNISNIKDKGKLKTNDFTSDYEIRYANDRERKIIERELNDNTLYRKIRNIYRIKPRKQFDNFSRYMKENNITVTKMLWHGSRNENWLSIILESLSLNPNAIITGKMFGNGIYFASESDKSYGYTSGGRWNGEYSKTRYMGLYTCAYGKPYEWYGGSKNFSKEELKKKGCDCVHAYGSRNGGHLYRDEIIFFDENAMCLEYLVEFEE